MSNNPAFPAGALGGSDDDDLTTREVDGQEVLDADANDDAVDSADADRLASTDPDEAGA